MDLLYNESVTGNGGAMNGRSAQHLRRLCTDVVQLVPVGVRFLSGGGSCNLTCKSIA